MGSQAKHPLDEGAITGFDTLAGLDAVYPFAPPEPPAPARDRVLPLSLSQHEVWRDQMAWAGSAHLNLGGGAFLVGRFDLALFRRALEMLVAENDALRLIPRPDGSQVLMQHVQSPLRLVDVGGAADPQQAMRDWWQAWMREPFSLSDGQAPWRMALLRASDELHGLTIQFHHLVMDGWGTSLVMQRWSALYNTLTRSAPEPPRADPGYVAFVGDSNAYRQSPTFVRDAAYWREQVPELPAALLERRVGALHSGKLSTAHLEMLAIARADYQRLREHCAAIGSSPFNHFLAALALYFAGIRACDSVVIGVPSLNRAGRRFRDTFGMFVGVMAVRVDVRADMTAAELVASVGLAMRGALRHPRYPLSELGRTLEIVRQGRDGVFDVLLSFERQDYAVAFGGAALVDSRQLFSGTARYPLGVTVCEFHADQDLELILEGSDAYFEARDMAPLARRIWHLVRGLMEQPNTRITHLPLLPAAEHHAVVHGLHAQVRRHEAPSTWISDFERQVAGHPHATALVWDGGEMDYATLDRRANRLAHRLVGLGAGRDRIVALAIARSPELVIAMLAINKAGAAFLPLDPDAPTARMADILAQSEAVAFLVDEENWERLAHLHERTAVTHWRQTLTEHGEPEPPAVAAPGDIAYVLFTSGSTGRPKGVVVEHAVLSRRLAWLTRVWGIQAADRSALATQATFDPFLIELCLPLVNAGSVAVAPAGRLRPETVADFVLRQGVSLMALVPSTLAGLLDGLAGGAGLKLRVACCGGEVLPPELARRFGRDTGGRLYNVYGPTEACIFATAHACGTTAGSDEPLPIGAAIDDTRIYVLDAHLHPLPLGETGEIYIGGDTLARGYLGQPELTARVFVGDPFQPAARMYRTGDRGWLGWDGQLHFAGRIDRQIKLRGYRIELGEIEAALMSIEGATRAAAKLVVRDGRPAIHAWLAAAGGDTVDSVQRVLRVRLPDYMIPASIHLLSELPLTPTGKIDYEALPEIVPSVVLVAQARMPVSKLEAEVLALWEGVLRRKPMSVTDNFFDAGGDSLAALSILTGIEKLLGRKVPLYLLTEHPSVERLVAALGSDIAYPGLIVELGSPAANLPVYLAASGHGDLMRFKNLASALAGVCTLHMLQPPQDQPISRITDLAALYADRIQARNAPPGFIAGFSIGGITALETARLLEQRGVSARGLILVDTVYPKMMWGGTLCWRVFGWLVRVLHIQDLSINGRRLGALFCDPGLIAQVMAMSGYRIGQFGGPVTLVKTSGLSRWDRMLFGSWRRLLRERLVERHVEGLHGSIFEPRHVQQLAQVVSDIVRDAV